MPSLFHKAEEFIGCFGAKHSDAMLAEIRYALENRGIGNVAARMENAAALVEMGNAGQHLLFECIQFPIVGHWTFFIDH